MLKLIFMLLVSAGYYAVAQTEITAPPAFTPTEQVLSETKPGNVIYTGGSFVIDTDITFTTTDSPLKIQLYDNPGEVPCNITNSMGEALMSIRIGDIDYKYGKESGGFNYDLAFQITLTGTDISGANTVYPTFTLYLKSATQEFVVEQSKVIQDYFGYDDFIINGNIIVPKYKISMTKIRCIANTMVAPLTYADVRFQLKFNFTEHHYPSVADQTPLISTYWVSNNTSTLNIASNQSIPNTGMTPLNNTFIWYVAYPFLDEPCYRKPDLFQIQVLRLYNINPNYAGNPTQCYSIVDWSKATTIEVKSDLIDNSKYSPLKNFIPTEGSGFYIYRVRPIFDYFGNGLANSLNYGEWNSTYIYNTTTSSFTPHSVCEYRDGSIIDISSYTTTEHCAFYIQVDEDLNWVHNRNFSEGSENTSQLQEQMSYYDNLLNQRQTQSRVLSQDQIIAQQSLLDMVARPVGQSLPVPIRPDVLPFDVDNTSIQYRQGILPLLPSAYDYQTFAGSPTVAAGSVHEYYNGDNTFTSNFLTASGHHIPSASGLPYSLNFLSNDGLGRTEFAGSPGNRHNITNIINPQTEHATQYFYGKSSQKELNAMFGDRAPQAKTINKNYVLDPNGKISVSYVNSNNQVIATAMKKDGMNSLNYDANSYGSVLSDDFDYEFTDQIADANTFYIKGNIPFPSLTTGSTVNATYKAVYPTLHLELCHIDLGNAIQAAFTEKGVTTSYSYPDYNISPRTVLTTNIRNSKNLASSGIDIITASGSGSPVSNASYTNTLSGTFQGDYKFFTKLELSPQSYFDPIFTGIKNYFNNTIYDSYELDMLFDDIEEYKYKIAACTTSAQMATEITNFKTRLTNSSPLYKHAGNFIWTAYDDTLRSNIPCMDEVDLLLTRCNDCTLEKYAKAPSDYDYAYVILQAIQQKFSGQKIYGRKPITSVTTKWSQDKTLGIDPSKFITIPASLSAVGSITEDEKRIFDIFFHQYGLPLGLNLSTEAKVINRLGLPPITKNLLVYNYVSVYDEFNTLVANMKASPNYTDYILCQALEHFTNSLLYAAVYNVKDGENEKAVFNTSLNTLDILLEAAGGKAYIGSSTTAGSTNGYISKAYEYYKIFPSTIVGIAGSPFSKPMYKFITGNQDLNALCVDPSGGQDAFGIMRTDDYSSDECGASTNKAHEKHYLCYSSFFTNKGKSTQIKESIEDAIDKGKESKDQDGNTALGGEDVEEYLKIVNLGANEQLSEELIRKYFDKILDSYLKICSDKKEQFAHSLRTFFHTKNYYFNDEDFAQLSNAYPSLNVNYEFPKHHLDKLVEMLVADCKRYATDLSLVKNIDNTYQIQYSSTIGATVQKKYLDALHKSKPINIDYVSYFAFGGSSYDFRIGNASFSGQGVGCAFQAQSGNLFKNITFFRDMIHSDIVKPWDDYLQGLRNAINPNSIPSSSEYNRGTVWTQLKFKLSDIDDDNLLFKNMMSWQNPLSGPCHQTYMPIVKANDYTLLNIVPYDIKNQIASENLEDWDSYKEVAITHKGDLSPNHMYHVKNATPYFVLMPNALTKVVYIAGPDSLKYKYNQYFSLGKFQKLVLPASLGVTVQEFEGYPIYFNTFQQTSYARNSRLVDRWGFSDIVAFIGLTSSPTNLICDPGAPYPTGYASGDRYSPQQACKITYTFQSNPVPNPALEMEKICTLEMFTKMENVLRNKFNDALQDKMNEAKSVITNYYRDLPNKVTQSLKLSVPDSMTYFTLFMYDRAGNLAQTIPPLGAFVSSANTNLTDLFYGTGNVHTMATKYKYNSRGQVIETQSPDETQSNRMWYNFAGQLRFSQSARQQASGRLSYNLYDNQGRIYETGELKAFPSASDVIDYVNKNLEIRYNPSGLSNSYYSFRVKTEYSGNGLIPNHPTAILRTNLRNRINNVMRDEDGDTLTLKDQVSTYYSYDLHGNVAYCVQKIPVSQGSGASSQYYLFATTYYEYDLLSKKVKKVWYNYGQSDSHLQNYIYDSDNRLTKVESSRYDYLYDRDANYYYYPHGPLKRVELGEDKLQGIDYTYTLQGWLKGINHVDKTYDPGVDMSGDYPQDAFSMILNYNTSDFINNSTNFTNGSGQRLTGAGFTGLFDGNIASWENNNAVTGASTNDDYMYQYDLVSRLKQATTFSGTSQTNLYNSSYSYDANGNFRALSRLNNGATMDNLTYNLVAGTNKLQYIIDMPTPTIPNDIELQPTNNYDYDASGNLTRDVSEGMMDNTSITWTPDGKVKQIVKSGQTIQYLYDAMGQRVMKKIISGENFSQTIYARDANGQVMAIYERDELPISGNDNPGINNCYEFEMQFPIQDCYTTGVYCYGTDFIIDSDGSLLFIRDVTTTGACATGTYSHTVEAGTRIGTIVPADNKYFNGRTGKWEEYFGSGLSDNLLIEGAEAKVANVATIKLKDNFNNYVGNVAPDIKINRMPYSSSNPNARLKLAEWHVYGNESQGRFVTRYPEHEVFHQWNLSTNEQNNIFSRNLGFKSYELKDHLGNVRTTVSDVKIPNGTSFLADMITKNEYYPFGMLIDGQSVSPTNYRYSFNTQEISTEINQNHTTAEFWEYDSRSGRRWNLDPIDQISISNYASFANNPIQYNDIFGLANSDPNKNPDIANGTDANDRIDYDGSTFYWNSDKGKWSQISKDIIVESEKPILADIIKSTGSAIAGIGDAIRVIGSPVYTEPRSSSSFGEYSGWFEAGQKTGFALGAVAGMVETGIGLFGIGTSGTGVGVLVLAPSTSLTISGAYVTSKSVAALIAMNSKYVQELTNDPNMYSKASGNGGGKNSSKEDSEHTKNKRPSTKNKHEKGQTRKNQKNTDKKRQNNNWHQNPNKRK